MPPIGICTTFDQIFRRFEPSDEMIMNYKEFSTTLKGQVDLLSYQKGLELAVAISKKLFFEYHNFYKNHQWGDPDLLLDAINICEASLSGVIDPSVVSESIHKIEAFTPDTEDYGDYDGSYALNACTVVCEALEFIIDKHPVHIFDSCILYMDNVNFKIHELGDVAEDDIEGHSLMIEAQAFLIDNTK